MASTSFVIALGSNRRHGRHGAPAQVIQAAVASLRRDGLEVQAVSRTMRSAALGPAGRDFANAAILVKATLDPPALLALLKRTERAFGRRPGRRWGPRVLDLDILLWSGGAWQDRRLIIPHPGLPQRAFALVPAAEIAPRWRSGGLTVRQHLARLRKACPVDRGGPGQ